MPPSLNNRRVTLMGLGGFGGGVGAVQFLLARGARVSVTDLRSREVLRESLAQFDESRLEQLVLGEHPEGLFTDADLIVVNPAVRRDHPLLQLAESRRVELTSEMNLFWQHQRGRVIGVTGSNGKSTTTALIHHLLTAAGRRTWLGGNLGRSLLSVVEEIQPGDDVVLELSSFMLADLDRLRVSPHLSVVTSFAPNHLDWHPDLDDYRRAKQTILRWQGPEDIAVLNGDDPDVRSWPTHGQIRWFGESPLSGEGARVVDRAAMAVEEGRAAEFDLNEPFPLPGRHNRWNAAAAIAAVRALGVSDEVIRGALPKFVGLPHRLQKVAVFAGRTFYNDSLATTPESALCALEAFDAPVILLAGGYDKKVDLDAFTDGVARRAKAVALMGQTAATLEQYLRQRGATVPRHAATDLADAFAWAVRQSAPGDVILLSPACASFDWFRNFADRGDQFTALARSWTGSEE